MANLHWETMSKYFRGKKTIKDNFRDQKAGNKFENNFGKHGKTSKYFKGTRTPLGELHDCKFIYYSE